MKKHPILSIVLLIYVIGFTSCKNEYYIPRELNILYVDNDSLSKILEINDSIVIPIIYTNILIDKDASPEIRKQQFINQILPAILIVKFKYNEQIKIIEELIMKIDSGIQIPADKQQFIDSLMIEFRAESHDNLLMRLKPHATSLVLAQAALESGWGTSKSSQEGYNLFGIWATPQDSNILVSKNKTSNKRVYMKRYESIDKSIEHYFLTLGRNDAYKEFRRRRYNQDNVFEIIKSLGKYSELKNEYTHMLRSMVKYNDFEKYDCYTIDSTYISDYKWFKYNKKRILNQTRNFLLKNEKTLIQNNQDSIIEIETDSATFDF